MGRSKARIKACPRENGDKIQGDKRIQECNGDAQRLVADAGVWSGEDGLSLRDLAAA